MKTAKLAWIANTLFGHDPHNLVRAYAVLCCRTDVICSALTAASQVGIATTLGVKIAVIVTS